MKSWKLLNSCLRKNILIVFIIMLLFANPQTIKGAGSDADVGGSGSYRQCTSGSPCYSGRLLSDRYINGVRISIYKDDGQYVGRAPNTVSADFVIPNQTKSCESIFGKTSAFKKCKLKISSTVTRYSELKSRDERIDENEAGLGTPKRSSSIPVYSWKNVSKITKPGDVPKVTVHKYLLSLVTNEQERRIAAGEEYDDVYSELPQEWLELFQILNFNTQNISKEEWANYYIRIEPLALLRRTVGSSRRTYYGTVTDVASLLTDGGKEKSKLPSGWFKKKYGQAIYISKRVQDGNTYNYTTDLYALESAQKKDARGYYTRRVTKSGVEGKVIYGLATGHIWLGNIEPPKPCTTDPEYNTPKCIETEDQEGHFSDYGEDDSEANWNCIFSNSAYKVDNTTYYAQDTNRYCTTICREDIDYTLPDPGATFLAGRRFTIGEVAEGVYNLGGVSFTAISSCRTLENSENKNLTNKIRYDLFETDFKEKDQEIRDVWTKIQIIQNILDDTKNKESCSKNKINGYKYEINGTFSNIGTTTKKATFSKVTFDKENELESKKFIYSGNNTTTKVTATIRDNTCITNVDEISKVESEIKEIMVVAEATLTELKSELNRLTGERNSLVNDINKCNNVVRTYSEFNPIVSFTYEDEQYGGSSKSYLLTASKEMESYNVYYKYESKCDGKSGCYKAQNLTSDETVEYPERHYWGDDIGLSKYVNNNESKSSEFIYTRSSYGSVANIDTWDVNSEKVIKTTYQNNDYIRSYTIRENIYELDKGIYDYITKDDGKSYSSSSLSNPISDAMKEQSYYIPYSSLPLMYSTPEGTYSFEVELVNLFGEKQKFYNYKPQVIEDGVQAESDDEKIYKQVVSLIGNDIRLDEGSSNYYMPSNVYSAIQPIFNDFAKTGCYQHYKCELIGTNVKCSNYLDSKSNTLKTATTYEEYSSVYSQLKQCIVNNQKGVRYLAPINETMNKYVCTYNVENKIIVPNHPGKLYVVYRPISLANPFSGQDGNTRQNGSNWTDEYVENFITNNRGAKGEEVYNMEPLYQFVLNSANIKAIRSYNKNNPYENFDFECYEQNGRNCISNFLKNGENKYFSFAKENGGKCYGTKTAQEFNECRCTELPANSLQKCLCMGKKTPEDLCGCLATSSNEYADLCGITSFDD